MAIVVNKVKKRNPLRPQDDPKWHLACRKQGVLTEADLARLVANRTSLNRKEAEMAFALLREILLEKLADGYTIQLSDWAYLYLTITSEGSEDKKDATLNKIKKVKLHLSCEESFKAALQKVNFITAESLMVKEEQQEP